MAIRRPDIYVHNNPDLPIVDSENLLGGAKQVQTIADLTSLPSEKLSVGTIVFVREEQIHYEFQNINGTGSSSIGNWLKLITPRYVVDGTSSDSSIQIVTSPELSSYVDGLSFAVKCNFGSGSNSTGLSVSVNGNPGITVVSADSTPVTASTIPSGAIITVVYDNGDFKLLGGVGGSSGGSTGPTGQQFKEVRFFPSGGDYVDEMRFIKTASFSLTETDFVTPAEATSISYQGRIATVGYSNIDTGLNSSTLKPNSTFSELQTWISNLSNNTIFYIKVKISGTISIGDQVILTYPFNA